MNKRKKEMAEMPSINFLKKYDDLAKKVRSVREVIAK